MSCMSLTNTLHLILDFKRGDFRYDVINTCIKFIKAKLLLFTFMK